MKIILAHKGIDVILKTKYHPSVGITSEIDCGNAFKVEHITEYEHNKVYFSTESKDQTPQPITTPMPPGADDGFCKFHLTPQKRGVYKVLHKQFFRGSLERIKLYLIIVF